MTTQNQLVALVAIKEGLHSLYPLLARSLHIMYMITGPFLELQIGCCLNCIIKFSYSCLCSHMRLSNY